MISLNLQCGRSFQEGQDPKMKQRKRIIGALLLAMLFLSHSTISAQESSKTQVQSLRVLILSTMLAESGIGEWGFSALVEADGHRLLFDTGRYPDTVLRNARELGIDLSDVTDVVLSHHHGDHTGGLLTLRQQLSNDNQAAISRVHVAKGIFESRRSGSDTAEVNSMIETKAAYEETGGVFIEYDRATELIPGVWITGPVVRVHPERNWSGNRQSKTDKGWVEDTILESQSLVVNTSKGLVILSGCGHAGIINTIEYSRKTVVDDPVYAVIGGFHLLTADDEHLQWTAEKLHELGVKQFIGAHCTGIEAVFQIRDGAGLLRESCVVGAVGASFDLDKGIDPLYIAR